MECARIREALLEGPERAADASLPRAIELHLPVCAECRQLRAALTRVDEGLSSHLRPPVLHPAFGARLRERLVDERRHIWAAWLPAAEITVVSHFLLTTAHDALDAAGD